MTHGSRPALEHPQEKIAISLEGGFCISTLCANALSHPVERCPAPPVRIAVGAVRDGCQESPHFFCVRVHANHGPDVLKEIATSLRFLIGKARSGQLKIRQRATRRRTQGSHLHPGVFYATRQEVVLGGCGFGRVDESESAK